MPASQRASEQNATNALDLGARYVTSWACAPLEPPSLAASRRRRFGSLRARPPCALKLLLSCQEGRRQSASVYLHRHKNARNWQFASLQLALGLRRPACGGRWLPIRMQDLNAESESESNVFGGVFVLLIELTGATLARGAL